MYLLLKEKCLLILLLVLPNSTLLQANFDRFVQYLNTQTKTFPLAVYRKQMWEQL